MNKLVKMWRYNGWRRFFYWIFYRGINYLIYYRCYCFFSAASPDVAPREIEGVCFRYMDYAEFERVRNLEKYLIKLDRVEQLLGKGYEVCGAYENGKLVSYLWINSNQVYEHVDFKLKLSQSPSEWLYLLKAYTIRQARGKGYSALLRQWLLQDKKAKGMLFDIESVNYPSLNTVRKDGARLTGRLRVISIGPLRFSFGKRNNRFFEVLKN